MFFEKLNPEEMQDMSEILGMPVHEVPCFAQNLRGTETALLELIRPGLSTLPDRPGLSFHDAAVFRLVRDTASVALRDFPLKIDPAVWGERYEQRINRMAPGLLQLPLWAAYSRQVKWVADRVLAKRVQVTRFKKDPAAGMRQMLQQLIGEQQPHQQSPGSQSVGDVLAQQQRMPPMLTRLAESPQQTPLIGEQAPLPRILTTRVPNLLIQPACMTQPTLHTEDGQPALAAD